MKRISCLCLTYGMVELLEEALYSFLNIEYEGDYELVIINDFNKQKLHYDHPRVRIINLDKMFDYWGDKEQYGIDNCKYEYIQQFDNDDICFPKMLQEINNLFEDDFSLAHWANGLFWMGDKIEGQSSLGNSGIVFTKDIVKKIGRYPHNNNGADMFFLHKVNAAGKIGTMFPEEPVWNYRWGQPNYNLSGLGGPDEQRPLREQVVFRNARFIEDRIRSGLEKTGDIELKPHWKKDYYQIYQEYKKTKTH